MAAAPLSIPTEKCLGLGERVQEKIPKWERIANIARIVGLTLLIGLAGAALIAALATGVGGIVAGCVGSAAIVGFAAAGGGGFGFVATLIGLGSYFGARRVPHVPCTSTMGLDADKHQAPALGSYCKNDVIVLGDPVETKDFKLEFLKQAKHSLEISGNYVGGAIFREKGLGNIREAMQANPNLQVHFMACTEFFDSKDKKAILELHKDFPDRFHYLLCNYRLKLLPTPGTVEEHVKMIVVDGKYYIQGGSAFQDHFFRDLDEPVSETKGMSDWFVSKASDMDLAGKGPTAKTLRLEFYKLWAKWSIIMGKAKKLENRYFDLDSIPEEDKATIPLFEEHDRRINGANVKVLVGGHEHSRKNHNAIRREYVRMIRQAKKTVQIANLFFTPHRAIRKALHKAIKGNRTVTINTNRMGKGSNPSNKVFVPCSRLTYKEMLLGGASTKGKTRTQIENIAENSTCTIYEFGKGTRERAMQHKKVIVVDPETEEAECIIGSYNLGQCSERHDEMVLSIRDQRVAKAVSERLKEDDRFSHPVSYREAKQHGKSSWGKIIRTFVARFSVS